MLQNDVKNRTNIEQSHFANEYLLVSQKNHIIFNNTILA